MTLLYQKLKFPLYVSYAFIILSAICSIQHYDKFYQQLFMSIGVASFCILYPIRFWSKTPKYFIDIVRLIFYVFQSIVLLIFTLSDHHFIAHNWIILTAQAVFVFWAICEVTHFFKPYKPLVKDKK